MPATATSAAPPSGHGFDYSLLADETQRARLEPWLERLPRPEGTAPLDPGWAAFAACVSAWRDHPGESTACIQSRIVPQAHGGLVVLHAHGAAPGEDLTLECIGAGGYGRASVGPTPDEAASAALDACVHEALASKATPPASTYAIRSPQALAGPGTRDVRARATALLVIAVDHAGLPRGGQGTCQVSGRVKSVVRGAGLTPRGRVELAIPCRTDPTGHDAARIDVAQLHAGSYARLYLDDAQTLLDYERIKP